MDHVPFKHKRTTLERAEKFISKDYFTDINLRSRLYTERVPLKSLKHHAASGRLPYSAAMKEAKFQPVALGQSFGPVWSTHWFELQLEIPASWAGKEVHLLWNSGSEALVYVNGEPRQGLSSDNDRISFIVSRKLTSSELKHTIHIEMACNHLFGIGNVAIVTPEDDKRMFTLAQAELALFNRDVFNLILDVEMLHDIAKHLPEDDQRGYQALYAVNEMINQIDVKDKNTYKRAQDIAHDFFKQKNGQSQHVVYAMGHAHIDTAWLWPYAETIRKCARSWTCTLRLMEKYPQLIFTCSQAQQYAWVKEHYPSVWKDICTFVHKGQFVPVGGTWVEMDGNIPSGESCVRQFLYGQNFFMKEFGMRCKEFWLPDTFGYSAQFPQIMRHCGVTRFLTQKLSWSLVNKFPHHTFHWEGIDGSSILAHFPPGDSYHMTGRVGELLKTKRNFKDKGRSNRSAFLYGYGDGGHGPSEDMLGRLERVQDCDGLPKVRMSGSDEFFSSIEQENNKLLCHWRGELYLEMHNGTYTTWAKVKKNNRLCEIMLHNVEALNVMAYVKNPGFKYPYQEIEDMWKLLLLNQFHDVLPGSSINQVFHDAIGYYNDILKSSKEMIPKAIETCSSNQPNEPKSSEVLLVNTLGFTRHEVVTLSKSECASPVGKKRKVENNAPVNGDGDSLVEVIIPPLCIKPLSECLVEKQADGDARSGNKLQVVREDDHYVMTNGIVWAVVDQLGRVTSLKCFDETSRRWSKEAIDADHPANQFLLYDDVPLYWDAWDVMDYHLETRKPVITPIQRVKISDEPNDVRVALEVSLKISEQSYLKQEISLDACSPYLTFKTEVTWYENRKFLKVEFPTTVHTTEATYDIQSGFLHRPNHYNTSWDSARYEVCGHKWADLSEHNFGVAVINDSKYGHAAVDGILRMSLLRSPKTPDPKADMDVHEFSYALMPHVGTFQDAGVINAAQSFNCPLQSAQVTGAVSAMTLPPLFELDTDQVFIQAVKMAEDRSKTIILRLHEAWGGTTNAVISTPFPVEVEACNGLEEQLHDWDRPVQLKCKKSQGGTQITVHLSPFQIVSLRCSL